MAHQLMRPLRHQWPRLHHHHHYSSHTTLLHHLHHSSSFLATTTTTVQLLPFLTVPSTHRSAHFKPRGLKLPNAPVPSDLQQFSDSDSDSKRSRNDKKREARRAVRWGMELAAFSDSQIKRIIRVASLEPEVFEALMLVKRLGPDVREGKRRQYNLIGKKLKSVQPEFMDTLIQATKEGDLNRLQALSDSATQITGDDDEVGEEFVYEDTEEISNYDLDIANRWYDGLINKDIDITNEVYSIHSIDFDRQELRKLVRKVHSIQERQDITEDNKGKVGVALTDAKKSLTRFLRSLAKCMPIE